MSITDPAVLLICGIDPPLAEFLVELLVSKNPGDQEHLALKFRLIVHLAKWGHLLLGDVEELLFFLYAAALNLLSVEGRKDADLAWGVELFEGLGVVLEVVWVFDGLEELGETLFGGGGDALVVG